MRCQGKGGLCPNPATTFFAPGYYCDICVSEVDRVAKVMQSYIDKRGLIDGKQIKRTLEGMGFRVYLPEVQKPATVRYRPLGDILLCQEDQEEIEAERKALIEKAIKDSSEYGSVSG